MPPPRCRLPGKVYMIQRRTERRVHLFRPDPLMIWVFLYCLAYALQKKGVVLIAVVVMSNHYHIVVYDPDGRISELTELLNGLLTKTTQALRGWQGAVFDRAGPSYTELLTVDAFIEKTAYTIANPTAAGLVRYSKDWPGVQTRVADIGARTMVIERPPVFFAEDGTMPERIELRFEIPEALLEQIGLEDARARIAAAVEAKESNAHAEVKAAGWSFKGAERVLKSSPYDRAKTFEDRGELNPRYACAGDHEALQAAITRDTIFVAAHASARERWLAGERDVLWPAGTDAMRRRHHVRCADPPC
jgi:putative transposase